MTSAGSAALFFAVVPQLCRAYVYIVPSFAGIRLFKRAVSQDKAALEAMLSARHSRPVVVNMATNWDSASTPEALLGFSWQLVDLAPMTQGGSILVGPARLEYYSSASLKEVRYGW